MKIVGVARSVASPRICRGWNMPRLGVDGADGSACDVSIPQRLDVEIKVLDGAQPVGQGAQQLGKLSGFGLRFGHANRLEAEAAPGGDLREPPEIGRYYGCDLGVAAAGAAIRHQDDRLTVARYLDAAVHRAVGNDVVTMQGADDGS